MDVFDNKNFKKAFWYWFDNLPSPERKKFYEYPSDMAELFFYNKIFRNIMLQDQVAQLNRASRYEREG